ncbi:MAG: FkbM family methyltransferase [Actinomycetota bacterium]
MRKILRYFYMKAYSYLHRTPLGVFLSTLSFSSFLKRWLKADKVVLDGHTIYVDELDSLRLTFEGKYEPFESEIVEKTLREGDVVLDVGANIGCYTLIAAKAVGSKGRVYAFEPDPNNFALLKRNIEVNNYHNVTPIQKAVTDKTGTLKLYVSDRSKGDHRIFNSYDGRESIEIEAIKLDDYFINKEKRIDFIKMDIQGAEANALKGMTGLIQHNDSLTLTTEFAPALLELMGTQPRDYLELLVSLGFQLKDIDETRRQVNVVSVSEVLAIFDSAKKNDTNLLCVKSNKSG